MTLQSSKTTEFNSQVRCIVLCKARFVFEVACNLEMLTDFVGNGVEDLDLVVLPSLQNVEYSVEGIEATFLPFDASSPFR